MLSRFRISSHWPAKFSAMRGRLRIGEHARHLRVEHLRRAQLAPLGQRQQLVVGHRVPQEVAQPRGQLDVRDPVHRGRIGRVAIALDVKQEVRRDEHRLNRERDALLDGLPVGLRQRHELRQRGDFRAASPAAGTRGAPASTGSGRRRRRRSSDRRPGSSRGSASRPVDANGPTTVTEPIHLLTVSL